MNGRAARRARGKPQRIRTDGAQPAAEPEAESLHVVRQAIDLFRGALVLEPGHPGIALQGPEQAQPTLLILEGPGRPWRAVVLPPGSRWQLAPRAPERALWHPGLGPAR